MDLLSAVIFFTLLSATLGGPGKPFGERVSAAVKSESVEDLEALYQQTADDDLKGKIELRLAMIFNQRTGKVDFTRSITWFDRYLLRDLPDRQLADLFILRGNCHKSLK